MTRAPKQLTLGDLLSFDPSHTQVSEREWVDLVRAIAAGDRAALHAVYERSCRPVFTLILRIAKDQATAEAMTVDVYRDLLRRAPSYDPRKEMVLEWILRQARSRATRQALTPGRKVS